MLSREIARGMKGVLYNRARPSANPNRREWPMSDKISRREFVVTSTAGLAAVTQAPAMITKTRVKPVIVASANGHQFRNGGPVTCVEKAFSMMTSGADVLEALIAGVNIVELD